MPAEPWDTMKLGDVVGLEYGCALPAYIRSNKGSPVFGSSGVVGHHNDAMVLGPGIIVGRKGTVGSIIWSGEPFWPIDTTYFVVRRKEADWRWLFWRLSALPLSSLDTSTGVPGLNRNDAYQLSLDVPPLPQQRRIAEILDTLDEAIRATEQVIAKLQQVKQGLLHDLLTRGIDEHGELRDPERHPEQFKDSPLGRIPKGWEVASFERFSWLGRAFLKTGPFGSSLKGEHWVESGVPVITIGALGEGEFIHSELLFISARKATDLAAYAVEPGDVVFSRVADVGRSVVVRDPQAGWVMSSNLMWISLDPQRVVPSVVWLNLSGNPIVRRQVRRSVNAGGREVANGTVLRSLRLAWPEFTEQQRIVEAAVAHQTRITEEQEGLHKLRTLKHGLMDDLLTGRVRVPVPKEASP